MADNIAPIKGDILWVGAGNTCRSPMAAELTRAALGKAVMENGDRRALAILRDSRIESAGTFVDVDPCCEGNPANAHAIACMESRGRDIRLHRSRSVSSLGDLKRFSIIVCITKKEAMFFADWQTGHKIVLADANINIPNPHGQGQAEYEGCAKALEQVVNDFVTTHLLKP